MVILTLDTTTRAGSSAIWIGDRVMREQIGDPERSHAERLPNDLARLLAHYGFAIRDVSLWAVASGPGSFTGLRVGISTVQSLALVYDRLIVPISALEILAYCGARDAPPHASTRGGYIISWMEAYRGDVFSALYVIREAPTEVVRSPRDITDPKHLPLAHLEEIAAPIVGKPEAVAGRWEQLLGAQATSDQTIVIGDAVATSTSVLLAYFPNATLLREVPLAGMLARLAAREPQRGVLPHAVMPQYVRPPDAQLARDRLQVTEPGKSEKTEPWSTG